MRGLFFLEYVVYILFSERHNKTYVGFTSDLINRFQSHDSLAKKGYTTRFRPWKVVHVEFFNSKTDALKREVYLKSGAGRNWIANLLIDLKAK
jgi:putative endonuclease